MQLLFLPSITYLSASGGEGEKKESRGGGGEDARLDMAKGFLLPP
jgi:hypothetical protein